MLVLTLSAIGNAEPVSDEIALVVSEAWEGAGVIDLPTLRRVYLGRQTRVDGQGVRPLHLPSGNAVREGFSRSAQGSSDEALERYWIEQALLGGALPPREFAGPAAMLRAVRAQQGSIGYVSRSDLPRGGGEGIRVLAIAVGADILRPGEAGYPLKHPGAP